MKTAGILTFALGIVAFFAAVITAYVNNVLFLIGVEIGAVSAGQVAVSVLGVAIPPIGVFHGAYLWF